MPDSSFIGYVGDADFHDGSIVSVEQHDATLSVRVRGASGKQFICRFQGVVEVRAAEPAGMVLYALSEMSYEPPLRRFVFANWDDDSKARLEVVAAGFTVSSEQRPPPDNLGDVVRNNNVMECGDLASLPRQWGNSVEAA